MSAPLYTALHLLAQRDTLRCHMPGHAGRSQLPLDPYALDYTEIDGTGNLYEGSEPIASAERAAADYFGAKDCFFLTGGSTMGLQSALAAAAGTDCLVAVDRNCHRSVCHAMALLNQTPYFLYPNLWQPFDFSCDLPMEQIHRALAHKPAALIVTSPTYFGVRLPLGPIAQACHAAGVPLIVDEAHGAHFPAVGISNAMAAGADLAIVSAHKTLPCLGQGAFLLSNGTFSPAQLRQSMMLFGTSSPSYAIMASMDLARDFVSQEGGAQYRLIADEVKKLRRQINCSTALHALEEGDGPALDPTRLTLLCPKGGLTGTEIARRLYGTEGIVCEMATDCALVLILTCAHTAADLHRIGAAVKNICPLKASVSFSDTLQAVPWPYPSAIPRLSVRQAVFSPHELCPLKQSVGRICGQAVTPYPPGVPLLYPGEEILQIHVELFEQKCYTLNSEITVVSPIAQA